MAQFRFVVRSGPVVGKVYPLEAQEIYIGRESTNLVVINDAQVSRRHAKLELRGTGYLIQDLGSTNGTFVNGTRIGGTHALNHGDTVALGEGIVLGYESAMDLNPTVLSNKPPQTVIQQPTPAPLFTPAPTYKPAPAPAATPKVVPAPVYSGQVPAGPVQMPPAATTGKKKFPVWIVIVIILLLITCACVGFFLIIDQLKLWCTVLPFLVPLLGGKC